jgi:hypothetical protein
VDFFERKRVPGQPKRFDHGMMRKKMDK